MFQPWTHLGYRIGFHLLLFSVLAFVVWSHVVQERTQQRIEAGA